MIAETADVDPLAQIGENTRVWHLSQIRENASIGSSCVIGRGAYIDHGVQIGDNCKIQNAALIYAPAVLGRGVFVGPAAILTNDLHPRAVNPDGGPKTADDWEPRGITVGDGASIGAGAIILPGVEIGAWALVAAGAIVTSSIPAHGLVGGIPARLIGWVGRGGQRLDEEGDGTLVDPSTGDRYTMSGDELQLVQP